MLTIKVYKIDVFTQTLYAVAIQPDELEDYYHAVGSKTIGVAFYLPNGDCFVVDNSDLQQTPKPSFKFDRYHQAIYGNALIVGTDVLTGLIVPPDTPLEHLRKKIQFIPYGVVPLPT